MLKRKVFEVPELLSKFLSDHNISSEDKTKNHNPNNRIHYANGLIIIPNNSNPSTIPEFYPFWNWFDNYFQTIKIQFTNEVEYWGTIVSFFLRISIFNFTSQISLITLLKNGCYNWIRI